ncbi:MAG: hypothetical protein ACRD3K_02220 [Edaphobacter sp.]
MYTIENILTNRFHDHARGSWMAGEVVGITGGTALFWEPPTTRWSGRTPLLA